MTKSTVDPETAHKLIITSLQMRDKAYAPYSNFQVGAALLAADGTIIGGCNVENASYGAGICAERTAITKAISNGITSFIACAVSSPLPTPSVSPCGICRQVLREFLPLSAPIFMASSTYPQTDELPDFWKSEDKEEGRREVVVMTLEELLPMSFGPEHLAGR